MLTIQHNLRDILGGNEMRSLQSVSLRLQKFVNVEQRVSVKELEAVSAVAERVKSLKIPVSRFSPVGAKEFTMKLGGRMMVNHAGGVLENANLCLHRYFGFPYIPGSALKGIARHAAWYDWLMKKEEGDEAASRNLAEMIGKTFGCPTGENKLDNYLKSIDFAERAGAVSFLSANPADNNWKVVVDVLCSHGGNDTTNPNPVFFPAVEKGAVFKFCVAPIKTRCSSELLDFAVEYLKKGLAENGAGAKTAAGYGWFKEM